MRGGGRSAASSHCGRRENSIRSPRSGRSSRAADQRRPAPAEPVQRRIGGPRAFALGPVRSSERREQRARRSRAATPPPRPRSPAARARARGQPRHRRHREPRRMDEGEQLEQVEPRQIGIAEPLPDQRRVQHDVRRLGQRGRSPRPATPRAPRRRRRTSRCRHGLRGAREEAKERPSRSIIGVPRTKGQQLDARNAPHRRDDQQGLAL